MKKFFGLLFLGGIIFGCIEVWNWVWHHTPVEIVFTSNDITELPKHVTLKKIFLSPSDVISNGKGATFLYIPIRSMEENAPGKPLHFLLKTKDEALLAAYKKIEAADDFAQSLLTLKPILTKHEVSGMLDNVSVTSKERAQLLKLLPVLAPDFKVLEEGRHPSLFIAIFLLGMGVGAMFIADKLDGRSKAVVAPPPVIANVPPPIPEQK